MITLFYFFIVPSNTPVNPNNVFCLFVETTAFTATKLSLPYINFNLMLSSFAPRFSRLSLKQYPATHSGEIFVELFSPLGIFGGCCWQWWNCQVMLLHGLPYFLEQCRLIQQPFFFFAQWKNVWTPFPCTMHLTCEVGVHYVHLLEKRQRKGQVYMSCTM